MLSSGSSKGFVLMAGDESWSLSSRKFSLLISSNATKPNTKSYTEKLRTVKHLQTNKFHKMKWTQTFTEAKKYQRLHLGVNHEHQQHSVQWWAPLQAQLHLNAYTVWHSGKFRMYSNLLWEKVLRAYEVAMELRGEKSNKHPIYLHHPHSSWIPSCFIVGQ